jgi:hypothetical protein
MMKCFWNDAQRKGFWNTIKVFFFSLSLYSFSVCHFDRYSKNSYHKKSVRIVFLLLSKVWFNSKDNFVMFKSEVSPDVFFFSSKKYVCLSHMYVRTVFSRNEPLKQKYRVTFWEGTHSKIEFVFPPFFEHT